MEDKNIVKPVTVVQTELADKIIADINGCGLHPVIIMPVIEEIYMMMKNMLKETREREKADYKKSINQNKNNPE